MADICLGSAIEFSRASKRTSLRFILKSLRFEHASIFKRAWWNALARTLTPVVVLDSLKWLRTKIHRAQRAWRHPLRSRPK
jgi:hypothetical protein